MNLKLSHFLRNVRPKFHLLVSVVLPPLKKSKLNLDLIDNVPVLGIAPWTLSVPTVRFDLTNFKKDTTDPETYKQFYLKLVSEFPSSEKILTDSSKTDEGVMLPRQYPPNVSENHTHVIFRTTVQYILQSFELSFKIALCLRHVYHSQEKCFLILSDSLSSLQAFLI